MSPLQEHTACRVTINIYRHDTELQTLAITATPLLELIVLSLAGTSVHKSKEDTSRLSGRTEEVDGQGSILHWVGETLKPDNKSSGLLAKCSTMFSLFSAPVAPRQSQQCMDYSCYSPHGYSLVIAQLIHTSVFPKTLLVQHGFIIPKDLPEWYQDSNWSCNLSCNAAFSHSIFPESQWQQETGI